MREYVIFTDSSCDLPAEMASDLGVKVVQLDVIVDGEEPKANDKVDIPEFYAKLRAGKTASTAAVSIAAFKDIFAPAFAEGKNVLYIGFSS